MGKEVVQGEVCRFDFVGCSADPEPGYFGSVRHGRPTIEQISKPLTHPRVSVARGAILQPAVYFRRDQAPALFEGAKTIAAEERRQLDAQKAEWQPPVKPKLERARARLLDIEKTMKANTAALTKIEAEIDAAIREEREHGREDAQRLRLKADAESFQREARTLRDQVAEFAKEHDRQLAKHNAELAETTHEAQWSEFYAILDEIGSFISERAERLLALQLLLEPEKPVKAPAKEPAEPVIEQPVERPPYKPGQPWCESIRFPKRQPVAPVA